MNTMFPKGKRRYVCVNRKAIVANFYRNNLWRTKLYPTVIVVEDGKLHEFHDAQVNGTLKFDATRNDLPAKVFVETDEEIFATLDPNGEQTFLNRPPEPNIFVRAWRKFKKIGHTVMRHTPVVACMIGHD